VTHPRRIRLPAGPSEAELREKGSRFLARAERALDQAAAHELRARERRRFHDATHHVLAFRPVEGDPRHDDDGEPAGTAGRPVLEAIDGAGLRGVAVVVTRWFGGTKLGTGGLSRAYAAAARAALEAAPVVEARPALPCEITFEHGDTGAVMRLLEEVGARRGEIRYGTAVTLRALVPRERCAELERRLADATAGRAGLEVGQGSVLLGVE